MQRDKLREALAIIQEAVSGGAPEIVTVRELWSKYAPIASAELADWKTERGRGELHVLPFFGDMSARAIGLLEVQQYRAKRLTEPGHLGSKYRPPSKEPPSPATINREIACLRHLLNWSVECKLLSQNPITKIKMLEEDNIRQSTIDEQVIKRLLSHCDDLMQAVILVFYDSGMRRLEVCRLRYDEVNLETGVVTLGPRRVKRGRARRPRLTQRAIDAIRALPRVETKDGELSPFIFANRGKRWDKFKGRPYHPRTIYQWFEEACEKARVEGVNDEKVWLHTLRHSFIGNQVARGISERTIMKQTGHATRVAFDRYGMGDDSDIDAAVRKMEIAIAAAAEDRRRGPRRAEKRTIDQERRRQDRRRAFPIDSKK